MVFGVVDVLSVGFVPLLIILLIHYQGIRMQWGCEMLVVFRLGRYSGIKGPVITISMPMINRAITMDLLVVTIDVQKQAVVNKGQKMTMELGRHSILRDHSPVGLRESRWRTIGWLQASSPSRG